MRQAFDILGIQPTDDQRAIRAAFVRLARIYHPDRFVGQPDDVRAEAERRMKDATVAYDALSSAKRTAPDEQPAISDEEMQERADRYRKALEAREKEEEKDRARWRKWDEIERQARERAEIDARIEAMIRDGIEPEVQARTNSTTTHESKETVRLPESRLAQRLDAARRGETNPLVPQKKREEERPIRTIPVAKKERQEARPLRAKKAAPRRSA